MKKKNFAVFAVFIWFILAGSLVGIHFLLHKKPISRGFALEAMAIYQGLDDKAKKSIEHFESAIIRLKDGRFYVVGCGFESEEKNLISNNKLSMRKIDFQIEDPVLLERRLMVNEVFKTLNSAEKHCYADAFASVIFRDGSYYFFFDSKKYPEYILKYGTECKSCEELKKKKLKK